MTITTFRILVCLIEDNLSASDMLDRIEDLDPSGGKPPLATFYRELKAALDDGLVEIVAEEPRGGPGRPRQTYTITEQGRAAARREAERLESLAAIALSAHTERSGR